MAEHTKEILPQKANSISKADQSDDAKVKQGSHISSIIQKAYAHPQYLTHADVMQLQRTVGNQAVIQLFKDIGFTKDRQKDGPIQEKAGQPENDKKVLSEAVQMKENKTGLPDNLKYGIENLSGLSMDDVRVHYNSDKPAQLGALAYAQGTDVHVAPGQERHLPHEAWHVVQQAQGKVRPTMQMRGLAVNDNEELESEADMMGEKVLQTKLIDTAVQRVDRHMPAKKSAGIPTGNIIQARFYLKGPDNTFTWHEEDPDERLYRITDETRRGLLGGWIGYEYPVYVHRVLDSRKMPNTENQAAFSDAERTGVIPETLNEEVYTVELIYLSLDAGQRAAYDLYYGSLNEYCQEEDKMKVVEGALTNVKIGPIVRLRKYEYETEAKYAEIKRRQLAVFLDRFNLMTQYIKRVGDEVRDGSPIKARYFIRSTGSDPHQNGQHALYLIDRGNTDNKQLYKPHSLKFENALMGESGIIPAINGMRGVDDKKLPTMRIDPVRHTEQFVDRVGGKPAESISEASFKDHMFKLGMLEVIAKVFGVTDLHAENIIFGSEGPIAIDAECGGAYYTGTGIEGEYEPVGYEESELFNPSAVYVGGTQRTERGGEYGEGKASMTTTVKSNREVILEQWEAKLERVDSFRILPFSTLGLSYMLESIMGNTDNIEGIRLEFASKLQEYITRNVLLSESRMVIDGNAATRFIDILRSGTLPSFEFQVNTGRILMDGAVAATPAEPQTKAAIIGRLVGLARGRIDEL